jgi:CDP-glucose 4,6-dehydratase
MKAFGDFYAGRRVLVTGHTGFKGSWLLHWLEMLGAEVSGLAVDIPSTPSHFELTGLGSAATMVFRDIRDRDALSRTLDEARPDVVFHLAAQPLVRRSYDIPLETLEVNVLGTANLLEAVRAAGAPCAVVVATSDKCYDNTGQVWGYRECDPMGGHDPYSMSKGAAELVVSSWRDSYFSAPDSAIRLASARAGNVIGGGDWAQDRLVVDGISAIAAGRPIVLRSPAATRPWQHVLEPLGGYLLLGARLAQSADPQRYAEGWNFGPDPANVRPVRDVAEALIAEFGRGEMIIEQDAAAPHEAFALALNCDKAHQLLDWHPVWGFRETIARTVAWYDRWLAGEADLRAVTRGQIDDYVRAAEVLAEPLVGRRTGG